MRRAALSPLIYFHRAKGALREARKHRSWLQACWMHYAPKTSIKRIDYQFVSHETIAELHGRFLGDPSPTDVLTFDYGDSAEIFVCPAVIREQARAYGEPFSEALRRVLVHGILHLCGLRDKTPQEQRVMREVEDLCLRAWQTQRFT